MPPPPPSKSYLLVLDTDSEDEEEDSYRIRTQPTPPRAIESVSSPLPVERIQPPANNTMDPPPVTINRRRPHVIEDEEESEEESAEEENPITSSPAVVSDDDDEPDNSALPSSSPNKKLTKNQKKKQAKKRKKKKSKSTANKSVSFSTVNIQVYPRAFGEDAVPADGGWPLGMELKPLEGLETEVPVEDYEREKQDKLWQRWKNLEASVDDTVKAQMLTRPKINGNNNGNEPVVLETRQWDFRSKLKNPLFGVLNEEKRQTLLLDSTDEESHESSTSQQHVSKGRTRSNSVSSCQSASSPKRRSRSSSFGHSERFNETYNQVYVHHVRNGLEQLRTERTKSGATGCNCRKLAVYIPPKGGGGKKAQHRRLKPSKLTQELKKRGLYDASASREDLEKILHDAVEAEPCCRDEDCFCYRNGIDCQDDACTCWHDSHVHAKHSTTPLTVEGIAKRCGNPLGTTTVDMNMIQNYREEILANYQCYEVAAPMVD